MGDLTVNLSRDEFACRCGCGLCVADHELVEVLQELCNYFGAQIHITSASRCSEHNASVAGGERSQHLKGLACDFVLHGVPPKDVQARLRRLAGGGRWGIGTYDTFTHFDVRKTAARWTG